MTFTANQRLTIVLSFLAALVTVGIVSYAAGASNGRASESSAFDHAIFDCETLDVSESSGHTDDVIALLMHAGWQGRAGDGAERLYSPAC